jgi:hypothetical protein
LKAHKPNERIIETDQRRLIVSSGAIVVLSWIGDFLFWKHPPGLSVGVFFAGIAIALLVVGRRSKAGAIATVLLLAACGQSAIELCFTNIASLILLTIVLFGETAFGSLAARWPRWSEAFQAMLTGPLRWANFVKNWAEAPWISNGREALSSPTLGRALRAAIPAAILALIFATLLGSGNAILADVFSRIATGVKAWLLEISFGRTMMWLVWLTVGVTLLWPKQPSEKPRWWTRPVPLWIRGDERLARWQGAMVLGAVNALFFAANTIDVLYLWLDGDLPTGIGHSQFLHQGVYSLIAAVLLAAFTLVVLFQQQPTVARNSILRGLAMLWIAQNIILILGVLRRLQFYVHAYQLSELRVFVGCFLMLVTCGFLLLGREIWKGMNLGRLFFANAITTFALFFTLQFCDVGTWVANWNVARWIKGDHASIDIDYLVSLGPKGWPGLSTIASSDRNAAVTAEVRFRLSEIANAERESARQTDWRSFQARRAARRAKLFDRMKTNP